MIIMNCEMRIMNYFTTFAPDNLKTSKPYNLKTS